MKTCSDCVYWQANQVKPDHEGACECLNPTLGGIKTMATFGCNEFIGSDSTAMNVPQHTPNGIMDKFKNEKPVEGVEILIVTHAKDFDWLVYALRCARKHLSGFQGITVAFPRQELERFKLLLDQFEVRLHPYDEVAGKGFLQHESKMGEADRIVPAGTRYVMHMDADCNFKITTTPQDYFFQDKPVYLYRTWESLSSPDPRDPARKVVSDCIMWKGPTEAQLGYVSDVYTMTRHPTVFPMDFYPLYRAHIEQHHRMGFEQYFLAGNKNSHPQDRMDFTAMGQFAWTYMRDRFHWINVETEEYPADRLRAYWSHGGISPTIAGEIENFLK